MLAGKVAIVTGAAQGIGRAIAEGLAQDGEDVAVVDLEVTRAEETARAVLSQGRRALVIKANVAEWADVAAMAARVLTELGRIDILVNNAGITRDSLLLRMKEEDWNAVLDVNLKGTFHCTKAVLPAMTKQRSGTLVNIASVVGDVHQGTAPLLGHGRQDGFGAVERALQVNVQHRIPVFFLHAEQQAVPRDARIVHQDVDAAEFGEHPVGHR